MFQYHPALRFKQGEYYAISRIARSIQDHVVPMFIIPPPKERDPEIERVPSLDEIAYLTGERIAKHWPLRPAFLDTQYVAGSLLNEGVERLFQIARRTNPNVIPVASVRDLSNPLFRTLLGDTFPRLGIHVPYEETDSTALVEGIEGIGCSASECTLFVDFTGADLDPDRAAGAISGILEDLGQSAPWQRLVFRGSVFPIKNPAEDGCNFLISRDEMKAFLAAMRECMIPSHMIGYGDFGADCGEINFPRGKGGGKAIRHLRYTAVADTLVVRGTKTGSDADVMQDVCRRVVRSGHFAGRSFSYADDRIWSIAMGRASCGNASMWREWNTAHHLTRVVHDLGNLAGVTFPDAEVAPDVEQLEIFGDF